MSIDFTAAMQAAARRTRAGDLSGATRVIQEALGAPAAPDPAAPTQPAPSKTPKVRGRIDPNAETVEPIEDTPRRAPRARPRRPLNEVVRALREGRGMTIPTGRGSATPPPVPQGARFETRQFENAAGSRGYKLYVPSCPQSEIRGLVVMLHGCKQDPDDFATGTSMNIHAEAERLLVAYPKQTTAGNAAACWNWFEPRHQGGDAGEPAILAGLARALLAEFDLGPAQVHVAGLSAGGAMAAVLAATHPQLFASVGIHSGLAHGAASDLVSAFAAMRGDAPSAPAASPAKGPRLIVFHGTADRTVHPANAERILEASGATKAARTVEGRSEGGRQFTRRIFNDAAGAVAVEDWRIEGAGHAWSGGAAAGSYTDPAGPDASAEMLRFFLER